MAAGKFVGFTHVDQRVGLADRRLRLLEGYFGDVLAGFGDEIVGCLHGCPGMQ